MADMPENYVISLLDRNDRNAPAYPWLAEAREALANSDIGVSDAGKILRENGTQTDFALDPVAGGLTVYLVDSHGTTYWIGSPGNVAPVLRWLISLPRAPAS